MRYKVLTRLATHFRFDFREAQKVFMDHRKSGVDWNAVNSNFIDWITIKRFLSVTSQR